MELNLKTPTVRLLAVPDLECGELAKFSRDHECDASKTLYYNGSGSDAQDLVETAGRVCYMSFKNPRPGGNREYIKHILEVGHGSVLEHANFSVLIYGISRSCSHEIVRHRAGMSYSQLSQRYVDESTADYICPEIIRNDPELFPIWDAAVRQSHEAYTTLAEQLTEKLKDPTTAASAMLPADATKTDIRKAARQAARSVLPNATETKLVMTGNARSWRHFFEQRAASSAEPEIRQLAYPIWELLSEHSPNLFGDYTPTKLPDGTYELTTPYRKV